MATVGCDLSLPSVPDCLSPSPSKCPVRASNSLGYLKAIANDRDDYYVGADAIEVMAERWTTPEMLALEADAFDRATAGPTTAAVPRKIVDAAITARPSISREQAEAVHSITTTNDPVAVLVGHAGTGKTFTLDAAGEAWLHAGLRPIGVALAGRAAAELQSGSGIPSQTIASFLKELGEGRTLTEQNVVLVDEAGMVGTRDLHRLLVATTGAGAKLVLVGGHKQLAEIEAGGMFAALARGLGAVELTENRRLQVPAQAATALALRNGDDADLCIGDWVLALRNDRRIGVIDGTHGTIAGMDEGKLLVDTPDGRRLEIPARYAAEGHLTRLRHDRPQGPGGTTSGGGVGTRGPSARGPPGVTHCQRGDRHRLSRSPRERRA